LTGFLDGKLAAALAKGFNGRLLRGTLRKVTTSGRDANGDPITSPTDYAVQGFVDSYTAAYKAAAGIPATDSKVTLIANLCAAQPAIGDKIMFTSGQYAGIWWMARDRVIDPAGATFELQSYQVPE
jgi:hypothetical protein